MAPAPGLCMTLIMLPSLVTANCFSSDYWRSACLKGNTGADGHTCPTPDVRITVELRPSPTSCLPPLRHPQHTRPQLLLLRHEVVILAVRYHHHQLLSRLLLLLLLLLL